MSNLYYINLTPFVPLSTLGEGEEIKKRGANAPLRHPIMMYLGASPLLNTHISIFSLLSKF
jgi:hypothetical protein